MTKCVHISIIFLLFHKALTKDSMKEARSFEGSDTWNNQKFDGGSLELSLLTLLAILNQTSTTVFFNEEKMILWSFIFL